MVAISILMGWVTPSIFFLVGAITMEEYCVGSYKTFDPQTRTCYEFINEKMTWHQSMGYCASVSNFKGQLGIIRTKEILDQLNQILSRQYWIALKHMETGHFDDKTAWKWVDQDENPILDANSTWNEWFMDENEPFMRVASSTRWRSDPSTHLHCPLCQFQLPDTCGAMTITDYCVGSNKYFDETTATCYEMVTNVRRNFDKSMSYCSTTLVAPYGFNGQLAILDNQTLFNIVHSALYTKQYYVALKNSDSNRTDDISTWYWIDPSGNPVKSAVGLQSWADLSLSDPGEDYIRLMSSSGRFADTRSGTKYAQLCQIRPPATQNCEPKTLVEYCVGRGKYYDSKTQKCFVMITTYKRWDEAMTYCSDLGHPNYEGQLAIIEEKSLLDRIHTMYSEQDYMIALKNTQPAHWSNLSSWQWVHVDGNYLETGDLSFFDFLPYGTPVRNLARINKDQKIATTEPDWYYYSLCQLQVPKGVDAPDRSDLVRKYCTPFPSGPKLCVYYKVESGSDN